MNAAFEQKEPPINAAQRMKLMIELWPKACRAMGWKQSDRELRLATLSEAVGRQLVSANEIGAHDEFSRVVDHLGKLAGELPAAIRDGRDELTERDRLIFVIDEQRKQLALYLPEGSSAEAYIQQVIRDKFNRGRRTERRQVEDLSNDPRTPVLVRGHLWEPPSELKQLVMTLSARINPMRKAAKHTQHDMHMLAGTRCKCKACTRERELAKLRGSRATEFVDESEPVGAELVVTEGNPF
jgi:hypothetical protein